MNKLLNIKLSKKGNIHSHLKNAINYICNSEKTEAGKNIFGINCNPEKSYDEFLELKKAYNKLDKRQGYHFILSFSPEDNISPELCNKITKEFCERYFKDRYQIVVATHNDQKHMHSHMIFNSVALDNGLKYHYQKGDWKKFIMPIVNELCEKYNLSTIELGGLEDKDISFSTNKYDRSKTFSRKLVKMEIDKYILQAYSFDNFLSILRKNGYKVNIRGSKTISITPPGGKGNYRLSSLGDEYTKEALTKRIEYKKIYDTEKEILKKSGTVISYGVATIIGIKRTWALNYLREVKIGAATLYVNSKVYNKIKRADKTKNEFLFLREKNISDKKGLQNFLKRNEEFIQGNKLYKKELSKEKKESDILAEIKKKIDVLKPCYESFLNGNDFFRDEYKEYVELEKKLKDKNMTVEKIEESRSDLFSKFFELVKKERQAKKEKKFAENCLAQISDIEKATENNGKTAEKIIDREKEIK